MLDIKKAVSPRPDLYRQGWLSLNGEWDFAFDDEKQGWAEKWYHHHQYTRKIQVPFCYQSKLSHIHDTGKHPYLWYHKEVEYGDEMRGRRTWLHFGAVDYEAYIWVNGEFAGLHKGGHTPFHMEITALIHEAEKFDITVYCIDLYDTMQPRGKQHWNEQTDRCWYTATSGIWQEVWLECTDGTRIEQVLITPDIDRKQAEINLHLSEAVAAGCLEWELRFQGELIKRGSQEVNGKRQRFLIAIENQDPIDNLIHLWSPETPNLYDLSLRLMQKNTSSDYIETYFGMRKIECVGSHVMLNHYPLYQKLVLDQGYWAEGLLTPPNRESLKRDIELVKEMGFNGVRKHQKVELPAFLYYADCLGLLVWEEMPSNYEFGEEGMKALQEEYREMILRDYNHPSVITWVPLNESWGVRDILNNSRQQHFALSLYHMTKSLDPTRLVSTNDGWEAVDGDILGIHDYESNGNVFFEKYQEKEQLLEYSAVGKMIYANGFTYHGEPVLITEFGGIAMEDGQQEHWGYNKKAADETEFLKRLSKLCEAVRSLNYVEGYCYTQLTDVEQETNGLLYADRTSKIPIAKIREIISSEKLLHKK